MATGDGDKTYRGTGLRVHERYLSLGSRRDCSGSKGKELSEPVAPRQLLPTRAVTF